MQNFKILAIAGLALMLGGCPGKEKINASPSFVCAELKQYSPAEQNRAADELERHAAQIPTVAGLIDDYGSLRAAMRAVCGRKGKKSG